MHCNVSNIIGVFIDSLDLFSCVIVEDSQHVVVGANDDPLLASNKFSTADGRVSDFNRSNLSLRIIIIDHHSTSVKSGEHPW